MAATIDVVLRLGMVAATLVAASAAADDNAAYVPQRNAPPEHELQARPQQRFAQQQDTEQRQPADTAAENGYQACVGSAEAAREKSWAAECKRLADKTQQDRADCLTKLNLSQTYCDASYPARNGSPNCTLPDHIATVLNANLQQARYRCVRQREGAEQ